MFGDLDDFRLYGALFLAGTYFPRYPLPIYGWFVVLALLPRDLALAGLIALSLLALVVIFKRRAVLWLLYVPVLQTLALGNLDVLFLALLRHGSPVALALLTLKPQLFLFALPDLWRRREMWRPFALWCVLLWLPPTLLFPQWIGMFIGGGDDRIVKGTSASLWPVPLLALALIVFMLVARRLRWEVIASALNPLLRAYDYTILAGRSIWLVPASWAAWLLMWQAGAAWPMALTALVLLR
jgi:hypothetical protein